MSGRGCVSTSPALLPSCILILKSGSAMLVNDHYTNLPLGPRSGEDHEALSAKAGKAGTADSISSTDENLDKTVMPTWCPLLRRQEI